MISNDRYRYIAQVGEPSIKNPRLRPAAMPNIMINTLIRPTLIVVSLLASIYRITAMLIYRPPKFDRTSIMPEAELTLPSTTYLRTSTGKNRHSKPYTKKTKDVDSINPFDILVKTSSIRLKT